MHEIHNKFLVCEIHSREVIWKVLRYVLYKENSTETADNNNKDVFENIVNFYQNNQPRLSKLGQDCIEIMCSYESLDVTKKDNIFTKSILEEINMEDYLEVISDDVRFVMHFRTLVHCASKETFRQIKRDEYKYDTPLCYKERSCSSWRDIIQYLSEALRNILAFLFTKNINGFKFVQAPNCSSDKADEVGRILSYTGDDLRIEISKQLFYNNWQVEKLKDRREINEEHKFESTFHVVVLDINGNEFEDVDIFADEITEKMEESFEQLLQSRFPNFEKWKANVEVVDILKINTVEEATGKPLEFKVVCKNYKGDRSFEAYSKRRSPQSRELWEHLRTAIINSCRNNIGIFIEVPRLGKWYLGSLVIHFGIKKTENAVWMYEELENLRRAVKIGLFNVFESYEMTVDILARGIIIGKTSQYSCTLMFSTETCGKSNEINHFLNEARFMDLTFNGKHFNGGFVDSK